MFYACIRKFNVTVTVQIFSQTKCTSQLANFICGWTTCRVTTGRQVEEANELFSWPAEQVVGDARAATLAFASIQKLNG